MSSHGNRSPAMKGRSQVAARSSARHHNGRNLNFHEPNMLDRSSHELPQPVDKTVAVNASLSDSYPTFVPHQNGHHHNANGSFIQREGIEVELVGHPSGPPLPEISRPQRTVSSSPRTPSGAHKAPTALSREQDR